MRIPTSSFPSVSGPSHKTSSPPTSRGNDSVRRRADGGRTGGEEGRTAGQQSSRHRKAVASYGQSEGSVRQRGGGQKENAHSPDRDGTSQVHRTRNYRRHRDGGVGPRERDGLGRTDARARRRRRRRSKRGKEGQHKHTIPDPGRWLGR